MVKRAASVVAALAATGLSAGTARAWCDEPWIPTTTSTTLPAGCPIDLWMNNAAPIYRWDGGVRGAQLTGVVIDEDLRSFGVTYGCLADQCSHHRTDFVFYPDRVRFTVADPPGTTVTLGDVSQVVVEYTLTDGGGCPLGDVGPAKQCGDDPSVCALGCDDEDDGGCTITGARGAGSPEPLVPIGVAAAVLAFVARRPQRRARV